MKDDITADDLTIGAELVWTEKRTGGAVREYRAEIVDIETRHVEADLVTPEHDETVLTLAPSDENDHEIELNQNSDGTHSFIFEEMVDASESVEVADDQDDDDDHELVTDGGVDRDEDLIEREEFAALAFEYIDEMLNSLGVLGIHSAASYSAPGEVLRRYPVETTGGIEGIANDVGNTRVLTDVRDYDGEHDVPAHEDVQFMTVRETTGYAAIESSATTALGWSTMPTPREIRLAEYLDGITERDLFEHYPNSCARDRFAVTLMKRLFPTNDRNDQMGMWVEIDDAPITNVDAMEHCVGALRMNDEDTENHIVSYRRYDNQDGPEAPLHHRLSAGPLISEHYFDNPRGEYGSESWKRTYIRKFDGEVIEVEAEGTALGYMTATYDPVEDGGEDPTDSWGDPRETFEIDSRVVCIPEMRRPDHVLDIPAPEPQNPHAEEGEE